MTEILDLSEFLNKDVTLVFTSMAAPVEGKLRPALRGGKPSWRYCVIGPDGKFVKNGRNILTFAEEDVFLLLAQGKVVYVREKTPEKDADSRN